MLGYKAHMGAGSITSNVKSDKKLVVVHGDGFDIETGMKKFGAMLGDNVEVGCNSVLNPGTVIGRESNVYPLSSVRGVVPERSIFKKQDFKACPNRPQSVAGRRTLPPGAGFSMRKEKGASSLVFWRK